MEITPDHELLIKYLDNKCTPEEAGVVLKWLSTPEGRICVENQFDIDANCFIAELTEPIRSEHMFQQTMAKIKVTEPNTKNFSLSDQWLKIAAAILVPLLLTNVILWLILGKPKNDITWQEVYVPKGEKLQVLLQDGTKIWLNSHTKLTYPTEFKGKQRSVKLEGEAYFVVKRDPNKPFLVQLKDLGIKVTGTSFNVKAYTDDNVIATTLDEGQIYLQTTSQNKPFEYLLKPGQQALFSRLNSKVDINNAAGKQNSAWKENKISFKDTPFEEVIKTLERWYNVKFEVEGEFPQYTYTINFYNEPLQSVLFSLEKMTPVKCDLKDGKIKIRKRNL